MREVVREVVSLTLVLFPALYTWWNGRALVRRLDDAAFAELRMRHHQRVAIVLGVGLALGITVSVDVAVAKIALGILAVLVAAFPLRRLLFSERRGLISYLAFTIRFWIGALGAWVLVALLPALVHLAGANAVPAGIALGILTAGWVHLAMDIFPAVMRATPLEEPELIERLAVVQSRARCPAPRLLRAGAPGGHWVNAFALPSHYGSGVMFTDDLLAALSSAETAAIYGHELAHLEHHTRRKLVVRDILFLLVVGFALALFFWEGRDSTAVGILTWAWPLACLIALVLVASRSQAHEHASDLRALELVDDPAALISALTKLHNLMRLPRRWGKRGEQQQTHPSLARRIRAIRDAAAARGLEVAQPPVTEIIVRSEADPSEAVVMSSDRLHWLWGVHPELALDPTTAWQEARDSRSIRYEELADLRLEIGRAGRRYLVATDNRGSTMRLALPPDAVSLIKANLERIELEVHDTSLEASVSGRRAAAHDRRSRFWAALALFTALLPPQSLPLFVVAGLALLQPARATLAAAGIIGIGAALLGFRTANAFFFDGQVVSLLIALKAVLGIALIFQAASRWRMKLREPPWAWRATVVALGAIGVLHLMRGAGPLGSPLPFMELHLWARYDSGFVIALLGISAALWTLGARRARIPALATVVAAGLLFATGTLWFRDRFGDDPMVGGARPVMMEALVLQPWRDHVVPERVAALRLSATGARIALRTTEDEYGGQYTAEPGTFDVELDRGEFVSFLAWDLQFAGDHLVALLAETDEGLVLERVRVWPEHTVVERIRLPRLKTPTLRVDPTGRRWEVASTDFGHSQSVRLRGVFGTGGYEETRWTFEEPRELFLDELKTNSGTGALIIASRFDFSLFDYLPLFLGPLGGYSTVSEVSVLEASGTQREPLAVTTLDVWCVEPSVGQRSFVCGGNDRESTTWIWSIDADRKTVTPIGSLAGFYYGGNLVGEDELLLQGFQRPPLLLHLASGRARWLGIPNQIGTPPKPRRPTVQQAGLFGQTASVFSGPATHIDYQAMAKQGGVIALATYQGGRSTVTVYRTESGER
jgi:Zn-dependent protease with chaperone function